MTDSSSINSSPREVLSAPWSGYARNPTFVLEVGVSESQSTLERLELLARSNQKANKTKSVINIDKWEWDKANNPNEPGTSFSMRIQAEKGPRQHVGIILKGFTRNDIRF